MSTITIVLDTLTSAPNLKATKNELKEVLKILKQIDKNKDALASAKTIQNSAKLTEQLEKLRLQNERLKQSQLSRAAKVKKAEQEESGILGRLLKQRKDLNNAIKSEKNVSQLKRLNTELKKTSKNITNFKNVGVQSTNTFSKALGSFAFKFNVLGNVIGNSISRIGRAVVEGFRKGLQEIKDFEKGVSELSAITGATGEDLDFLKQAAIDLGFETTRSAVEIVEAFKLVGSAKPELLENGAALRSVTRDVITLSEASGLDLATSTKSLTGVLNQFNLGAEQSTRVINALAAGAKFGAAEVPAVAEAITKFGVAANSANVSVEESVGLVELLAEKGIQGAEAGTNLRNVLIRLNAPEALPRKAREELEKFGVNLDLVSDKSLPLNERLREFSKISDDAAALVNVFGKENSIAGEVVLKNVDRFEELTKSVTGTSTAFEQAREATDNLAGDEARLEAAQTSLTLSIDSGNGVLSTFARTLSQAQLGATKFFAALNDSKSISGFEKFLALTTDLGKALVAEELGLEAIAKRIKAITSSREIILEIRKIEKQQQKLNEQFKSGKLDIEEHAIAVARLQRFEAQLNKQLEENSTSQEAVNKALQEGVDDNDDNTDATGDNTEAQKAAEKAAKKRADELERLNKVIRKTTEADEKFLRADALETDTLQDKLAENQKKRDQEALKASKEFDAEQKRIRRANRQTEADEADEAREQREKDRERRKEELKDFGVETTQLIIDGLKNRSEEVEAALEKDITTQDENIRRQQELADKGLENTLAFEERKKAELLAAQAEEQKRQERIAKAETFFKLLSAFASDDPKTAVTKALQQIVAAEIVAATFEGGGIVDDVIDNKKTKGGYVRNGIFHGRSHSAGGILIEAQGKEGILSVNEMANLGKDNFYAIKEAASNPVNHNLFEDQIESFVIKGQEKPDVNNKLLEKLDEVKHAVDNIPGYEVKWDSFGNLEERMIKNGSKRTRVHMRDFKRRIG